MITSKARDKECEIFLNGKVCLIKTTLNMTVGGNSKTSKGCMSTVSVLTTVFGLLGITYLINSTVSEYIGNGDFDS